MNLGLISLIALLAAIVIGFVRKANVGILCIGFSMILGLVYGIKAGDIIKGFSSSLCMQMIGITYLFAIINENGTLELLAKKMVALVGPHKTLIPFVMYLLGFLICAVGPGAIPSLAIVPGCDIRRCEPDHDGNHRRSRRYVRTYEPADSGERRCP